VKSRFQEVCPRRLKNLPTDGPCPLALRSIEAWQNGERDETKLACPFFTMSSQYSNCFFSQLDDQNGHAIESDREIAKTLGLTDKEVKTATAEAITKIKAAADEGNEDVKLLLESLADVNALPAEADIYAGENWLFEGVEHLIDELTYRGQIETLLNQGRLKAPVAEALLKRGPGRPSAAIQPPKGTSGTGAVHHSGKIQLFALSSNWNKVVKKFQEGPTPIRMATNSLVSRERKLSKKDMEDEEKS